MPSNAPDVKPILEEKLEMEQGAASIHLRGHRAPFAERAHLAAKKIAAASGSRWAFTLSLALLATLPSLAHAQQPLEAFLQASDTGSLDLREARATRRQSHAQLDEARARLLPNVLGQFTYQHNDPVVSVTIPTGMLNPDGTPVTRQASITPADQLGVSGTVTVPILDLTAWSGYFQTEANAGAADALVDAAEQNVDLAVVQGWHQLVAQRALVAAAQRNLSAADRANEVSAARLEVGAAAQLEVARSEAELARARQSLREAELASTLAARRLEDLTGLRPSEAIALLDDDLHAERPLREYLPGADNLPAVRAARAQLRAASIGQDGAWLALLPTIAATGVARWSNAAGFGRQDSYYVGLSATWALDFARPARVELSAAALDAAAVRSDRAEQQAETAIFEAWERVDAARGSAEAAESLLAASQRAAEDARARYESGAATQLDQIQAERDLFQAEVGRIQALANLRVARAALRIRAGEAL